MTQIETAFLYALTLYGTEDLSGAFQNSLVQSFFKDAGFSQGVDASTPWCAAFLNAIFHRCGIETTDSLLAKSFLDWGEAVVSPSLGDVVIFDWTKIGQVGEHVAIVTAVYPTIVYALGGNEQNMVEIRGYDPKAVMAYRRIAS